MSETTGRRRRRRKRKALGLLSLLVLCLFLGTTVRFIYSKDKVLQRGMAPLAEAEGPGELIDVLRPLNREALELVGKLLPRKEVTWEPVENPMMPAEVGYYYREHLEEEDRDVYESLYRGLLTMEAEIPVYTRDTERVQDVITMLLADHPELFWFDGEGSLSGLSRSASFEPDYTCSKETAEEKKGEILALAEEVLPSLTAGETQYEQVKAAYEYIINRVDYDLYSPENQNLTSSLLNQRSVCAGYARGLQYLLQRMGYEAVYVCGDIVEAGSHAWLKVKLGDTWYNVDPTFGEMDFSSPSVSASMPKDLRISYDYLCCTDEELLRDRTQDVVAVELPVCSDLQLNYQAMRGRHYDDLDQARADMRADVMKGERYFLAQFSTRELYLAFKQALDDGAFVDDVSDYLKSSGFRSVNVHGWHTGSDSMYSVICWYSYS